MKRIINLAFFILFINISYSQNTEVNFENELIYKLKNNTFSWYVSNNYPNIMLVNDTYNSKNYLYYLGKLSYYELNENDEIEYSKIEFNEIVYKITEISKSKKKEVINGIKCDKFIIHINNEILELFIDNKSEINNVNFLNKLILNGDKPIFKSGHIVKISSYIFWGTGAGLDLLDIKKSNKTISVDFKKLDLKLNEF